MKCPGSLAYIIDGVAKLTKHARIHPTRPDGLLQFQQVVDCPLQPERHAPKSFAGRKKLYGHSQHPALFGRTQGYHSRRGCFSRAKVSQLDKAADGRAASHVEQPTVHVDFFGFSKLDDACAIGLQPLHLHGNHYRVTVTPPVFSLCDRYLGARLVRWQEPPPFGRAPHSPAAYKPVFPISTLSLRKTIRPAFSGVKFGSPSRVVSPNHLPGQSRSRTCGRLVRQDTGSVYFLPLVSPQVQWQHGR